MVKHFRVAGGLRLRLEEAGVLIPAVLRRAGLPQNLFEQTRILVSTEELFALTMQSTFATNHLAVQSWLYVAIIMDGNGRWAERRGLPRIAGHRILFVVLTFGSFFIFELMK